MKHLAKSQFDMAAQINIGLEFNNPILPQCSFADEVPSHKARFTVQREVYVRDVPCSFCEYKDLSSSYRIIHIHQEFAVVCH